MSIYEDTYRPGSIREYYVHFDGCFFGHDEKHEANDDCTPQVRIALPHQYDTWCIGGLQDVEALIADLQTIAARLRGEQP